MPQWPDSTGIHHYANEVIIDVRNFTFIWFALKIPAHYKHYCTRIHWAALSGIRVIHSYDANKFLYCNLNAGVRNYWFGNCKRRFHQLHRLLGKGSSFVSCSSTSLEIRAPSSHADEVLAKNSVAGRTVSSTVLWHIQKSKTEYNFNFDRWSRCWTRFVNFNFLITLAF